MLIMSVFTPMHSRVISDHKVWLNFASRIKIRPSIALCVFWYSVFHSSFDIKVYVVYDPDIFLVYFRAITIASYNFDYISNSFENTK
jgi:hypothetical protein